MATKQPAKSTYINKKYWLYLLAVALLLYVVLPQVSAFKKSISLVEHASLAWLLVAVAASLGAHVVSGFKYVSVALKPLRVWPTVLVQLASLLVNRLLPAGIGGIGINYVYLHKAKHTKVEAAVVVSMNNLAGFVGHMLLLALVLLAVPSTSVHLSLTARTIWFGLTVATVTFLLLWVARQRFIKLFDQLKASLRQYKRHPLKVVWAVAWSMAIAAFYAACLWYCATALHVHLSFLQSLVVLTLGVAASSVSPTPGGLVGVEAALVAGLVAYKVTPAQALAIALLYRLITYWFALLLGALAFIICRKQQYF